MTHRAQIPALALFLLTGCPNAYSFLEDNTGTATEGTDGSTTAQAPLCGDGVLDAPEECDDGNGDDHDTCTNACTAAICGDGVTGPGEACDDGNDDPTDACTDTCTLPACGDGVVTPPEQCDDGDANADAAACTTSCLAAVCGDGHVWTGAEECDEGEFNDDAGSCTLACTVAACGDGKLHPPTETCEADELGNFEPPCRPNCTSCGDGTLDDQNGEECDEPFDLNGECLPGCQRPACGDGHLYTGEMAEYAEMCDDDNTVSGDGCSSGCYVERRVFITSGNFDGAIAPYGDATYACQALAQEAFLSNPTAYRAWINEGDTYPAVNMDTFFAGLYIRVDGKVIAEGWDDLASSDLAYPINVDQNGDVRAAVAVWSAVTGDGFPAGNNCSNFTTSSANSSGLYGNSSGIDDNWTYSGQQPCSSGAALYCFEDLP